MGREGTGMTGRKGKMGKSECSSVLYFKCQYIAQFKVQSCSQKRCSLMSLTILFMFCFLLLKVSI